MLLKQSVYLNNAVSKRSLLLLQVVLCSFFVALCAQIRIPLPFTPVPITLQTLSVMMIGGMLGSRNGSLAVLLYIAEALLGLPVLAGGRIDPLFLLSPVGGYIVGFVIQAYVVGWFVERSRSLGKMSVFVGLGIGFAMEFACGALWMAYFVGAKNVLVMGVIPFLPGELFKTFIAAAFFNRYIRNT
jgi:biotin transport system substrate-specific component